jgi:hypothetical protein
MLIILYDQQVAMIAAIIIQHNTITAMNRARHENNMGLRRPIPESPFPKVGTI